MCTVYIADWVTCKFCVLNTHACRHVSAVKTREILKLKEASFFHYIATQD